MTMTNVEVIRAIYDDWLGGGLAIDKFDPEITMVESSELPGGGASAHGIDAVQRYIESFSSYWEEIRFEPEEYIEAGDQVVVTARLVGRGKASGVDVQRTWAYVWTLRANKALRMEGYSDLREALRAVGVDG
ncbi:MAG: hypothetical protein JWL67_1297 [Solirubrobacterales bacterium]|jgi:ketosteroid isomerase-like protein|nr:hypothetical protein [Solirubrobacterales bacterium]